MLVKFMKDLLAKCNLCPRNCNVNRHKEVGFCKAKDFIKIARADLYYYEELCISGDSGSGAIFFSYCNLKCLFCQNYEISEENIGKDINIKLFKPIDKQKELTGTLQNFNKEQITLLIDNQEVTIERNNISSMKRAFKWE